MRTLLTDLRGNPIPIADRRSIRPHEKTTLMRYVETQAWNDVVRRARSHPEEVWQIDEQGNTALHLSCKFDPPAIIIKALSAAVSASNANGLTPLHVAASHRCNARALRDLVKLHPASLFTPSRRERTPMHYACLSFRGLEFDAFEALLEASLKEKACDDDDEDDGFGYDAADNKSCKGLLLSWKDSTGSTPLGLLFRRYRERVRSAIYRLGPSRQDQSQHDHAILLQSDLGQLWGKARLIVAKMTEDRLQREGSLLKAEDDSSLAWAVEHHLLGECKFRIVHASVGLVGYGCPPELIRLAIAMYPEQVREIDENGDLPLHIAAAASSSGSGGDNSPAHGGLADDDSSVYSLTSFFSSSTINATPHAFDKVIQILLREYPQAALVPQGKSFRLPLAVAIRAGQRTWDDGIKTLLMANPAALHSAKLHRAYPEALALVCGGGRPPVRQKYKGDKEGGLRIFQNLYLLSLHNRSNHGEGGRRANRRPRKHLSLNSSQGCDRSRKTSKSNKSLPPNPHILTTVFQLLRSNPDMVDPAKYFEMEAGQR